MLMLMSPSLLPRVYLSPAIATPAVMATFSINMVLNLAWIFLWDRYGLELSRRRVLKENEENEEEQIFERIKKIIKVD